MIEVASESIASRGPRTLKVRAQKALESSPIHELHDLRVEQYSDVLAISGTVSSFYHKQLAQEIIRGICKNLDVELVNSIQVL